MSIVVGQPTPNVLTVGINRPEARNAVDGPTARALAEEFRAFDDDPDLHVAVLYGMGGTFCAGADLKQIGSGNGNRVERDMSLDGPLGPTRMLLDKPVIAAVEGYAVAGGLELALWCDLRVAASDAVFGVFCRRWGVPLVDGGTLRLPRLIGHSHALDMILTGRGVSGDEAVRMGLVNRIVAHGNAFDAAVEAGHRDRRAPPALPALRPAQQLRPVGADLRRGVGQRDRARPGHDSLRRDAGGRGALRRRRGSPRIVNAGPERAPAARIGARVDGCRGG